MNTTEVVKGLRLKDKVAFCSGRDSWNTKPFPDSDIPSVMMTDGPTGLRKQIGTNDALGFAQSETATCFPAESLIACSFDKTLISEMGAAIAEEAGAAGVSMVLAPGVNIKRNPLCGRNFEYFSEDPYLAGKMGASFITAVQKKGIGASLKHFACNSQEYYRLVSDSIIDDRTLRELYLTNFEYAVKEGRPTSVMCAYNKINGTYCSDNKYLLTDILRDDWGYDGFVVTDWGALNDRSKAFEAGCDLAMPGGSAWGEKDVLDNIDKGRLDEKYVNLSAERILSFVKNGRAALESATFKADFEKHHELARRIAEGSAVLLKNDENILPCKETDIAVIGAMAQKPRFQGSGSSRVNPSKVDSVLSFLPDAPYAPGYDEDGSTTDEMLRLASDTARSAKVAVIVAGLPDVYEAEGLDRSDMKMPEGHNRLITEVAKANPNTVVALCCGCAVETPWADDVKAILYMGLSGQAGAGALVKILTGVINPSGRLAETWPIVYENCASASFYSAGMRDAEYREGLYVGYRYYDKGRKKVRFPFGLGMSYTSFSYENLKIDQNCVSITVTNTGARFGAESILMFIEAPQDSIYRPIRELKGFEKVFLGAGESKEVFFELDERSFAVWDGGWKVYSGEYEVQIGSCSAKVKQSGSKADLGDEGWYMSLNGIASREDWIRLLGYTPEQTPIRPFTVNSAVIDVAENTLLVRIILWFFEKATAKIYGRGSVNYQIVLRGAEEAPLRRIQDIAKTKGRLAQALADFGNKKFFRGIGHLFR